jgi:hypothetical protein
LGKNNVKNSDQVLLISGFIKPIENFKLKVRYAHMTVQVGIASLSPTFHWRANFDTKFHMKITSTFTIHIYAENCIKIRSAVKVDESEAIPT